MKKVILLLLFFPHSAFCQISFDFEDGSLTGWVQGSEDHWKADSGGCINGTFSLHHAFDNPAAGSDCIGIPLSDLHPSEGVTRWSFTIRHGYDPSASNSWALFLMSDRDPGSFSNFADVSGFAVGVNLSGYDDTLRLHKIKNGSLSVVLKEPVNWQNEIGTANAALIHVERNSSGIWTMAVYDPGNTLLGTASGTDPELFSSGWLVLNYRYTSTRDRLLWLDDLRIEGIFYEDRIPPVIKGNTITGRNSLQILFNEDPSGEILDPTQFLLENTANQVVKAVRKSPAVIEITFRENFINKAENVLRIKNLCDRTGNCTTNVGVAFTPVWPETGDIIISEIMADPVPSVTLPEKEYLEITNRTKFSFNLKGWSFWTENQKSVFPETMIGPGEILVLCQTSDTSLMKKYGMTAGLKTFPSLTDEGLIIWLTDSSGNFIHGVEYSSGWYHDQLKENGGWSLEMIDKDFPFYGEANWEASLSVKGGTPGNANSGTRPNPDMDFNGIDNVFPIDSVGFSLSLSETVHSFPDAAEKIFIGENRNRSIETCDPLMRKFIIRLENPLERNKIYKLYIAGDVRDFAGNEMTNRSFSFGLPERAGRREIVFNEILFNPMPDEPDFIELFNCSAMVLDASRLWLASINTDTGDTSAVKPASPEPRCILPGTFFAITTDRDLLIKRYHTSIPENIFEIPALPSMPDSKGHLLLLNREMEVIDEVIYSDDMHYSLLSGIEGISLEKIRPDIPSAESTGWHSASESSGWGTPGAANSVYCPVPENGDRLSFSSGMISPDNDGFEDVLVIDLETGGPGSVVTITIFDEKGGYVRRLKENFLAGEKASLAWDATTDDGSLVSSGIYIIIIELFDDTGRKKSWKKVCTVIR
jgi:hypothetical protein